MTLTVDSPNYTLNNGTIVRPPLEQVLTSLNAAGILTTADIATLVPGYSIDTWTPTVTASSGTFTTVSATGAYAKLSRLVQFWISITITNAGTAAAIMDATLPFTNGSSYASAAGGEIAVTQYALTAWIPNAQAKVRCVRYDGTTIIAAGRFVSLSGAYLTA